MATFNQYPQQYPYNVPQYIPNVMQQPAPPQTGNMIWVKGESQAESYPIAPNATVILWDSEQDTIYIKSTDVLGKPSIKYLDYMIRNNTPKTEENKTSDPEYATKQDLIDFMNQVSNEIKQLRQQPNRKFNKED